MRRGWMVGPLVGVLLVGTGCGEPAPSGPATRADLARLLEGLELRDVPEELQSPKKLDRIGAVSQLDEIPYDRRMDILETMWDFEQEIGVQTQIIDEVAEAEGERATRFLERVAAGPTYSEHRDNALYYLTLPPMAQYVDSQKLREILYQPDLPSDLASSVLLVYKATDGPGSRAILREAAQDHPDWEARVSAIGFLTKLGDQESIALFRERIEVEDQKDVLRVLRQCVDKLTYAEVTS